MVDVFKVLQRWQRTGRWRHGWWKKTVVLFSVCVHVRVCICVQLFAESSYLRVISQSLISDTMRSTQLGRRHTLLFLAISHTHSHTEGKMQRHTTCKCVVITFTHRNEVQENSYKFLFCVSFFLIPVFSSVFQGYHCPLSF